MKSDRQTRRFEEKQHFRSLWVWAFVLLGALPIWIVFAIQVVGGRPIGDNPAPDWALWTFLALIGVGLPFLFWWMRLDVRVDDKQLWIRFRPLRSKSIPHEEIQAAEAVDYSPLGEFGGWGVRFRPGFGWAYNVSGKHGVIVTRKDGRRMLIGSQRSDELASALEKATDEPVG